MRKLVARRWIAATVSVATITAGGIFASPAFADDRPDAAEVKAAVEAADPTFLDWSEPAAQRLRTAEPVAPSLRTAEPVIPSLSAEPIESGENGIALAVAGADALSTGERLSDNAVVFIGDSVSQVVADKGNGLIGIAVVIQSADAPLSYAFDFSADADITAELGEVGGGVLFLDGGDVVGGVLPPWAYDAEGREVPTHYQISGDSIVQVVDHIGGEFAYPIVADPTYYGESLISRVTATSSPRETHVYKSGWWNANIYAGNVIVKYQITDEYARITPSSYDTTGAREQVSCHAWFAPLKDPWNIELWRPTVGAAATTLAQCNPK